MRSSQVEGGKSWMSDNTGCRYSEVQSRRSGGKVGCWTVQDVGIVRVSPEEGVDIGLKIGCRIIQDVSIVRFSPEEGGYWMSDNTGGRSVKSGTMYM